MNLLEILDTKPEVIWAEHNGNYAGMFKLDGDNFLVSIDTERVNDKLVCDISFKQNGSMDFIGSEKNPSKIFGAVLNTLNGKLGEISPDIISVIVAQGYGAEESRMHTYALLVRKLAQRGHVKYWSDWLPFTGGHVMIIGRTFSPTPEEEKMLVKKISSK